MATVTVAHDQGVSDYTVDASPTSATIKQGQSAAFALTVTPLNGFNQAVSFTCTGLPAGASCTFVPPSVTPKGAPVTTTLTVTTAPSTHAGLYKPANWLWAQGGMFALAMLLFPGALRRNLSKRKQLAVALMLLVILQFVSLLIACGGAGGGNSSGNNSGGGSTGTPLGTSQVTVSSTAGSSGSASLHGASITITITQ